jgi:hypothetical protein
MARMQDWELEIHEALRKENWSLVGPNRIVKVIAMDRPVTVRMHGYVTVEQNLLGKTPHQIERALGLMPGEFRLGCRIFCFTRLPMAPEYEYELTAFYPDGLAFNPADLQEAIHQRRANPALGKIPAYPPGSRFVHQWRLTVDVPVRHLTDLRPGQTYRNCGWT